jgi:excisionase family DNA binding protein
MSAFLRVCDVAEELDVSTRTVLRWIDAGELEALRLPGGRLRIAESELHNALRSWSTSRRRMLVGVDEEQR